MPWPLYLSFFDILVGTWSMWYFHVNVSSMYKSKNFVYFTCSISWLFIVIETFWFDFFPLDFKIVKCVFLSLFAESTLAILINSRFIVSFRLTKFLWLKNRFVSWAKRIIDKISEHLEISFMYMRKRRGPKTDPWSTPHLIVKLSDFSDLYLIIYFLFIM